MAEPARYTKFGRYGEELSFVIDSLTIADEGNYFKVVNPTPGTAIADVIRSSFSSTAALFVIQNGQLANQARVYLDYLKLLVRTNPTNATSVEYVVALDNTVRYSTGGTTITTLANTNMDHVRTSSASVYFGAVTTTSESASVRRIARGTLRGIANAVNDVLLIKFQQTEGAPGSALGSTAGIVVDVAGPAIAGGGHTVLVHTWYPANTTTAAQFEFEAGWWER